MFEGLMFEVSRIRMDKRQKIKNWNFKVTKNKVVVEIINFLQ